jgi:hypothetical protein
MRRFLLEKQVIDGRPVYYSPRDQQLLVLGRDGKIWELDPADARTSKELDSPFQSYSQGEMRAELIAEMGTGYEVSGTGTYLVVHPAGQKDQWAARFESLYRQVLRYFAVRNIAVRRPVFPLVAVVYPTHQDFLRAAYRSGAAIRTDVLGYYDSFTNRILLYDITAGGRTNVDWRVNAETIIHEAAHQTAFNIGIHNRFTPPPRWICEGLGTLFEAPGVYDSLNHREFASRINHEQLRQYRRYFSTTPDANQIRFLVGSDDIFRQSPYSAYALSWALTSMFAEQRPSQLAQYLQFTEAKLPFESVNAAERLRDFRLAFGDDFQAVSSGLRKFMIQISDSE